MSVILFLLIVLIFSVIVHEISHGYVALWLGDPTAKLAGRLTLNPIAHVSFFGMVLLPLLTYFAWGIPVGAAKPVPYNPYNLPDPRIGGAKIAAAGPLSNFLIAFVFGLLMRLISLAHVPSFALLPVLFGQVVYINILLGVFNLVPLPPLDGSKVINFFLPRTWSYTLEQFWNTILLWIQHNWLLFLILFILFFQYVLVGIFAVIDPIIQFLYILATGQPFGV